MCAYHTKLCFSPFPNDFLVLVNMYAPIIALFIFELLLELISPTQSAPYLKFSRQSICNLFIRYLIKGRLLCIALYLNRKFHRSSFISLSWITNKTFYTGGGVECGLNITCAHTFVLHKHVLKHVLFLKLDAVSLAFLGNSIY